jgi:TonB-dependent receptor
VLLGTVAQAALAADSSTVESVTISASRSSDIALGQQRDAPNIIDVQSAETMAQYPDYNAGEALGRLPGISLSEDTGEGRYVTIRGIDGNLDGATFGGVTLLNTNPGLTYFTQAGRAVEFDTIPMGAIDGIVVTKTGMPSQEAEGLGGSIELTPRSAAKIDKDIFFEGALGSGYEALRPNFSPRRAELTIGGRFSPGKGLDSGGPFSFVLDASEFDDRRAIDDIEEAYVDNQPVTPDKAYDSLELRRYNYHRRRFGLGGEMEYNPSDKSGYFLRYSNAGYIESVNRQRLIYGNLDDSVTADPANPNGFLSPNAQTSLTLRDEEEQHRNTVYAAGGQNDFDFARIDYEAAYSRATYAKNHDYNWTFNGPSGLAIASDNISNPNYPRINNLSGINLQNPALYKLGSLKNSTENDADEERSYKADVTVPLHLIGDDEMKFGGKARIRDKTVLPLTYGIKSLPSLTLSSADGPGPFNDFYQNDVTGGYSIGYSPNADTLRSDLANAPPGKFVVKPSTATNAAAYLHAKEDVFAGYAQYVTTFARDFTVLAGVRVEHTDARYDGITTSTDATGATTYTPNSHGTSYTNAFPTVQLRYQPAQDWVVRATYSTGIARPGFLQASSSTQVDFGGGTVTTGNPDLKPTTGNSFDVSLEYYLPDAGVLSLGGFNKQFDNYILPRTVTSTNYPGIVGIAKLSTFLNVPSAHARGLEANYEQRLDFLPHALHGLGASVNATYVDSQAEIYPGYSAQLPGTSHWTANAAIFYEGHDAKARLSMEYVGKTQFGITGSPDTDNFEDHRLTLDFTSSYAFTDYLEGYFSAKNLTNAPLRFYEGSENRPLQREFYSYTLEWGVKVNM